jgi:hypothetical protein
MKFVLVFICLWLAEMLRRSARVLSKEAGEFNQTMDDLVNQASRIVSEYDRARNSFR